MHKNLQALERDIRAWIAQWNDNPQPFIWTKTADEILERLASYLDRIPGAGHQVTPSHGSSKHGACGRPTPIFGPERAAHRANRDKISSLSSTWDGSDPA